MWKPGEKPERLGLRIVTHSPRMSHAARAAEQLGPAQGSKSVVVAPMGSPVGLAGSSAALAGCKPAGALDSQNAARYVPPVELDEPDEPVLMEQLRRVAEALRQRVPDRVLGSRLGTRGTGQSRLRDCRGR